jgi:hypothetical protein
MRGRCSAKHQVCRQKPRHLVARAFAQSLRGSDVCVQSSPPYWQGSPCVRCLRMKCCPARERCTLLWRCCNSGAYGPGHRTTCGTGDCLSYWKIRCLHHSRFPCYRCVVLPLNICAPAQVYAVFACCSAAGARHEDAMRCSSCACEAPGSQHAPLIRQHSTLSKARAPCPYSMESMSTVQSSHAALFFCT